MKIYEPIVIALTTVLVLAGVFMLGKHTGYSEAVAARNAQLGITDTHEELSFLGTQIQRSKSAIMPN